MSIRTGQQVIILVEISSHRAPQVDPSPSSHSCPKAIISHVASESRSLKVRYLQAQLVGYRVGVAKGFSSKYYCSIHSLSDAAHVEELAKDHNVGMRVGHNAARGFHIAIPVPKRKSAPNLPSVFIKVSFLQAYVDIRGQHTFVLFFFPKGRMALTESER